MKLNLNGCGTHGAYTRRHFLFGSLAAANPDPRFVWLPRLQWALITKREFIFND